MLVIKIGHQCIQDLIYNLILECMRTIKKLKERQKSSKKKEESLLVVNFLSKLLKQNQNHQNRNKIQSTMKMMMIIKL